MLNIVAYIIGGPSVQSTSGNEVLECVQPFAAAYLLPTEDAGWSSFRPDRNKRLKQISNDSATTTRGMTSMLPGESAVYYPEELSLFGTILDQVMQSLPPNLQPPPNRTVLAMNILACASTGERDPDELRRAALRDSKVRAAA